MDESVTLYLGEPGLLPLEIKRGENWPFQVQDLDSDTGNPIDRTGWTGKMRIRIQSSGAAVAVTPTFVATDLVNGTYGFNMTIANTQALPLVTLEYDMFITSGATSICIYYGTISVHDNVTPIP